MEQKFLDYDLNNMFEVLLNTDKQIMHAIEIGKELPEYKFGNEINEIIILGMGGSAIGGDLLRSYIMSEYKTGHIRITVNRGYDIPEYVNKNSLIIASSYSGNTEETLSAFLQAIDKTQNIIVISSGGELQELAKKNNFNLIDLPKGFQPRCALGYSFFIMLFIIIKCKILSNTNEKLLLESVNEALEIIRSRTAGYSDKDNSDNLAKNLAKKIHGRIPVIYSSGDKLDVINLRWRGQFHENSKSLAFGNTLPEMNHNEVNSWVMPDDMPQRFQIVLMRDEADHSRVKLRFDALDEIFRQQGLNVISVSGSGASLLSRMVDLIYLGDWVSYYLAILYGQDPMSIPIILKLKEILSK